MQFTTTGAAAQPGTPVTFAVPPSACDCLTHIFGDPAQFPMAPDRTYTPEMASVAEIRALHRALYTERVVMVQPTIYGTDNACTLDAVESLGNNARGVAVIDDSTPDAALDDMDRRGIRGIRINLETVGQRDPAVAAQRFDGAVARLRNRPQWHIQVYCRPSIIGAIADQVAACPVPVSFDHFAGAKAADGVQQPGFGRVLELLRSGQAWVKLSAPYLASAAGPDYPDVLPMAQALIAANPERILWGTNWPHPNSGREHGRKPTDVAPLRRVDDGAIFNLLPVWAPDAGVRKAILVDNPARLYGF